MRPTTGAPDRSGQAVGLRRRSIGASCRERVEVTVDESASVLMEALHHRTSSLTLDPDAAPRRVASLLVRRDQTLRMRATARAVRSTARTPVTWWSRAVRVR